LNKKETKRFLKEVEDGLKKPVKLIPTPKLKEAGELVDKYNCEAEYLSKSLLNTLQTQRLSEINILGIKVVMKPCRLGHKRKEKDKNGI